MEKKEKVVKFIKGFSRITITAICKELGITVQNVVTGRTSIEKLEQVKEKIQEEYAKLFINKGE